MSVPKNKTSMEKQFSKQTLLRRIKHLETWEEISADFNEQEKNKATIFLKPRLFFKINEEREGFEKMSQKVPIFDVNYADLNLSEDSFEIYTELEDNYSVENLNELEEVDPSQPERSAEERFLTLRHIIVENKKENISQLKGHLEMENHLEELQFLKKLFRHSSKYDDYFKSEFEMTLQKFTNSKDWPRVVDLVKTSKKGELAQTFRLCKKYHLINSPEVQFSGFFKWGFGLPRASAQSLSDPNVLKFCEHVMSRLKQFPALESLVLEKLTEFTGPNLVRFVKNHSNKLIGMSPKKLFSIFLKVDGDLESKTMWEVLDLIGFSEEISLLKANKKYIYHNNEQASEIFRKCLATEGAQGKTQFKEELLDILTGKIIRSEQLGDLRSTLNNLSELNDLFSLITVKLLVDLFFSFSDPQVRLRFNNSIAKCSSVPLLFLDPHFYQRYRLPFYDFNYQLAHELSESTGVFNLGIGQSATFNLGAEGLINHVFSTQFDEQALFTFNSVDVDYGAHFLDPREIMFLNAYGRTRGLDQLQDLEGLYSILLVHISRHDLEEIGGNRGNRGNQENVQLLEQMEQFFQTNGKKAILIVRDMENITSQEQLSLEGARLEKIRDEHFPGFGICFIDEQDVKDPKNKNPFSQKILKQTFYENLASLSNGKKDVEDENSFLKKFVIPEQNLLSRGVQTAILKAKKDNHENLKQIEQYLNNKMREMEGFKRAVGDCGTFLEALQDSVEKNRFHDEFFYNSLFQKRRRLTKEIRYKSEGTIRENTELIEEELIKVKREIKGKPPTEGMKHFHRLFMDKNSSTVLLILMKKLKILNVESLKELKNEKEEYVKLKGKVKDKTQSKEYQNKIKEVNQEIVKRSISLEVMMRNLLPYLELNDSWLNSEQRREVGKRIIQMLKEGFPLELIDGENLDFKLGFMKEIKDSIRNEEVYPIVCLGPQSSGKSTLLNVAFGSMFETSKGRCTSGLYISLQRDKSKGRQTKWIMIVDTEGLQSPEKVDPEFDRTICTFILQNSKVVLLTLLMEIKEQMITDLQTTLYVLNQTKNYEGLPRVIFVFNQNPGNKNTKEHKKTFQNQICEINDKIRNAEEGNENIHLYDMGPENIMILGNAYDCRTIRKVWRPVEEDEERNIENLRMVNNNFNNTVGMLSRKVDEQMQDPEQESMTFKQFFAHGQRVWEMVGKYKELVCLSSIDHVWQKKQIESTIKPIYQQFEFDLEQLKEDEMNFYTGEVAQYTDISVLKTKSKKKRTKIRDRIQQLWESSTKTMREAVENQEIWNLELFNGKLFDMRKKKEIKEEIFINQLTTRGQMRRIDLYDKQGIKAMAMEANALKHEYSEKGGMGRGYESEVQRVFHRQFKTILEDFKKEINLEKLAKKNFDLLLKILESFTMFKRNIEYPKNYQEVTVEKCLQIFTNLMNTTENGFPIKRQNLKNLDRNVFCRFSKDLRFFKIRKELDIQVKVSCIQRLSLNFKKERLVRLFIEFMSGKVHTKSEQLNQIREFLGKLEKYGVVTKNLDFNQLNSELLKGEISHSQLEQILNQLDFSETVKIDTFHPEVEYLFDLDILFIPEAELKSFKQKNKFQYLKTEHVFPEEFRNKTFEKDLRLFSQPWETENRVRIAHSVSRVIREFFDFGKLLEEIADRTFRIVFQNSQLRDNGMMGGRYGGLTCGDKSRFDFIRDRVLDTPQITYDLVTQIYVQDLNQLLNKVDQELLVGAARVGDVLDGGIKFCAMILVWSYMMRAAEESQKRNYRQFLNKKDSYFNKFKQMVNDQSDVQSEYSFLQQIEVELGHKFWTEHIAKFREEMKAHLASKRTKFSSQSITATLNERYIKNGTVEEGIRYCKDQIRFLRAERDSRIKAYVDDEIQNMNKRIQEKMMSEIERLEVVLKHLDRIFGVEGSSTMNNLSSLFVLYDRKGKEIPDAVIKMEYSDKLSDKLFWLLWDVNQGQPIRSIQFNLGSEYTCRLNRSEERIKSLYTEIRNSRSMEQWSYDIQEKQEALSPLLEKILLRMNMKRIYCFRSLIEKAEKVIRAQRAFLKNKGLSLGELQVEDEVNKLRIRGLGCTHTCKFCNKKCDSEEITPHTHHANHFGHHPRFFAGGYLETGGSGKRFPSLLICDHMDKNRNLTYEGKRMTWENAIEYEAEDWEIGFAPDTPASPHSTDLFEDFDRFYSTNETKICDILGFSKMNKSIGEVISLFNSGQLRKKFHYIVCLDQSGSMYSHHKWKRIVGAYQTFIDKILAKQGIENVFISLLKYDDTVQVLQTFKPLSEYQVPKLEMIGGENNFGLMLENCIDMIENNYSTDIGHRILVYTDGAGEYPGKEIDNLKNMIFNQNIDIKLHWIFEEDPEMNTYHKRQSEVMFSQSQIALTEENCCVDTIVETEETVGIFEEAFAKDNRY